MTTTTSAASPDGTPRHPARIPAGGTKADIESLYRARFSQFLRVSQAIVGDGELARDVVQEAFAKALARRGTLRSRASLEPWVWRAVINCARDRRRADGVRRARETGSRALDSLHAPAPREGDPTVVAAVGALPERQRHVLFLRHYADLDYRTIARTLHMRPGTVAATLHAAQEAVRRSLEEEQ